MNDGYTFDLGNILHEDYRIAKVCIVKGFQLINLLNFNYIRADLTKNLWI